MSGLEIRDLRVRIGGSEVLAGLDLDVPTGQVTGLAGESGSGKSMTALALLGLLPRGATATGSVRLDGQELLGASARTLRRVRGARIALVFQDPAGAFHPMLSVGRQVTDHLRAHRGLTRVAADRCAVELLERVGIAKPAEALRRYPHQFSGGQLQRVAIASALACEPEVLVADEPTTALDVTVQAGVLRLLRGLVDELGLGILFVTHDLAVMSALADTVTVLRRGQVVESGSRFDVLTHPRHAYTRELIASLPPVDA